VTVRSISFICLLAGVTLLPGCVARPFNTDPAPTIMAETYNSGGGALAGARPWYESFGDETLNTTIDTALQKNLDIGQALARLDQAQAQQRSTRAGLFPAVNAEASTGKEWERGNGQGSVTQGGLALAWEIDAFGRIRAALASDDYRARAAAADVETVRLALSADIATNYFQSIAQGRVIHLLREQEKLDRQFYDLITLRYNEGVGTRLEQLQQEGQLAQTRSLIPDFESRQRFYENRLDVLLGRPPDGNDIVAEDSTFSLPADPLPVGVPAELLLNRPDLRALKNELIAADADISRAFAERLPRLTLEGTLIVSDAPGVDNPLTGILAGVMQPILDWGARKAVQDRNEALYRERLLAFSQLYLTAIEDVETTLYQENKQREYIKRLEERRRLLSDTVETSQSVYTQGLSDYLPVLTALQDLRALEREIIIERLELALLRVGLYRALGGAMPQQLESGMTLDNQDTPKT